MPCNDSEPERLRVGVWRRARWDWAYRIEIKGYGSVYGCGFANRERAIAARNRARAQYTPADPLPGTERP